MVLTPRSVFFFQVRECLTWLLLFFKKQFDADALVLSSSREKKVFLLLK
jgi:hypothetical protein